MNRAIDNQTPDLVVDYKEIPLFPVRFHLVYPRLIRQEYTIPPKKEMTEQDLELSELFDEFMVELRNSFGFLERKRVENEVERYSASIRPKTEIRTLEGYPIGTTLCIQHAVEAYTCVRFELAS